LPLLNCLYQKPTIYPPFGDYAIGLRRNTKYTIGSEDFEDRRGDVSGATLNCPFNSIDTISFSTMIKRELCIPGLWDCGSNLYQTIS
jgi:hypothetical protein